MTHLYLVRHAKAGERRLWTGDDIDRPLSKKGWKQAEALAKRLGELDAHVTVSSPYVRCIQTLEPLASRLGGEVDVDHRLCEDEPLEPVLQLLAEAPAHAVLCSHGDIIPAAILALKRSGTAVRTPVDWRKASVWVLKRNTKGQIITATVWPPPKV
ncbi:MAG: phosphoglycerate mutase family protein [Ilumatobacteraceae bacterium]